MQNASNAKESPLDVGASKGAKTNGTGEVSDFGSFGGLNVDVNGGPGTPGAGAPEAPRAGGSGLLHQNSNNSPECPEKRGYRLRRQVTYFRGQVGCASMVTSSVEADPRTGLDRDGRVWTKTEGETWERVLGGITSAEAKRAFALRVNVEAFTEHYAHEKCGFLTLTAEEADMTPKEFGRVWDDMRKHRLKWLRAYVRVIEAQKRGAPHYHLCAATPFDLKPAAFDWDALRGSYEARKAGDLAKARELTRRYAESATPELREIWAELRDACRHYGLGRSEMLPFRKSAGAVAHYVGKYLEGGLSYRRDAWKGARRVEYDRKESREWKRCASSFAWVSPGARAWRVRVAELARAVGAETPEMLVRKLGSRWAYHARPAIMVETEENWRTLLQYLAREYGGTVDRKAKAKIGGEVVVWYPGSDGGLGDESSPS